MTPIGKETRKEDAALDDEEGRDGRGDAPEGQEASVQEEGEEGREEEGEEVDAGQQREADSLSEEGEEGAGHGSLEAEEVQGEGLEAQANAKAPEGEEGPDVPHAAGVLKPRFGEGGPFAKRVGDLTEAVDALIEYVQVRFDLMEQRQDAFEAKLGAHVMELAGIRKRMNETVNAQVRADVQRLTRRLEAFMREVR